MRRAFISLLLCACVCQLQTAFAADVVYEGPWRTTNRKLDGVMTCIVTNLEGENWRGRFYGVWQGVPFDYAVNFAGPPSALRGTAKIDGADYTWSGDLSSDSFKGKFGGNRYVGDFNLTRKPSKVASER